MAKFVKYSTKGYSGITGAGLSKAVRDDLMLQAKQYRAKNPATQGEMDEYKIGRASCRERVCLGV